ncbi:MAG: type II 3-dehydroquinate dehydratase [Proteobacteria bacterium]|nr:type II 3-dehydroquinate dehydratase [Pseudomonadota bacterium]
MKPSHKPLKVLVINGPNLNMLGKREPELYGSDTLEDISKRLVAFAKDMAITLECFQSNYEGALVEKIQEAMGHVDGLVINPAAYTHTSVAIRDALLLHKIPVIEVHLSNIYKREEFRHHSMVSGVATGQIAGLGVQGYYLALTAIRNMN